MGPGFTGRVSGSFQFPSRGGPHRAGLPRRLSFINELTGPFRPPPPPPRVDRAERACANKRSREPEFHHTVGDPF